MADAASKFGLKEILSMEILSISALCLIVIILSVIMAKKIDDGTNRYVMYLAQLNLLVDLVGVMLILVVPGFRRMDPSVNDLGIRIMELSYFIIYACGYSINLVMTLLIRKRLILLKSKYLSKRLIWLIYIPIYILLLISQLSIFPNFEYSCVDLYCHFVKGDMFGLAVALWILPVVHNMLLLYFYGKRMENYERWGYVAYMMVPGIFLYVCNTVQNFDFIWLVAALTVSNVVLCMVKLSALLQYRIGKESEFHEAKRSLFLSQMKPSFLYNSLNSIKKLCGSDSLLAADMTDSFAEYLRQNMGDVYRKDLNTFEQEISHLENYIKIQKMNLGNRLNVYYECAFTEFKIPPLTLQPIVECAIAEGLVNDENDGNLVITSIKTENYARISISANLPCFTERLLSEEHSSLSYVSKRIRNNRDCWMKVINNHKDGSTVLIYVSLKSNGMHAITA